MIAGQSFIVNNNYCPAADLRLIGVRLWQLDDLFLNFDKQRPVSFWRPSSNGADVNSL